MNADAAMDELRGGYGVQCKQSLVHHSSQHIRSAASIGHSQAYLYSVLNSNIKK